MPKLSHWRGRSLPQGLHEYFARLDELSSIDLGKVRLYDGSGWLPRSVGAITLSVPITSWLFGFSRIYFCGAWARRFRLEGPQGLQLLAEELYHVKQQREKGAVKFYIAYLCEYFRQRRRGMNQFDAYNAISFEKEAKAFARSAAEHANPERRPRWTSSREWRLCRS